MLECAEIKHAPGIAVAELGDQRVVVVEQRLQCIAKGKRRSGGLVGKLAPLAAKAGDAWRPRRRLAPAFLLGSARDPGSDRVQRLAQFAEAYVERRDLVLRRLAPGRSGGIALHRRKHQLGHTLGELVALLLATRNLGLDFLGLRLGCRAAQELHFLRHSEVLLMDGCAAGFGHDRWCRCRGRPCRWCGSHRGLRRRFGAGCRHALPLRPRMVIAAISAAGNGGAAVAGALTDRAKHDRHLRHMRSVV